MHCDGSVAIGGSRGFGWTETLQLSKYSTGTPEVRYRCAAAPSERKSVFDPWEPVLLRDAVPMFEALVTSGRGTHTETRSPPPWLVYHHTVPVSPSRMFTPVTPFSPSLRALG